MSDAPRSRIIYSQHIIESLFVSMKRKCGRCGGSRKKRALGVLLDPAATVHERLFSPPRRTMQFLGAFFYSEPGSKLAVQRLCVIAHHIQSAAFGGTFRAERTDDHVAARPHCVQYRL